MSEYADEIEVAIRQLKAVGEYEQFTSVEAEQTALRIGELYARAVELSDDDVELIFASAPESPAPSRSELEQEVASVPRRARRGFLLPALRHRQKLGVIELAGRLVQQLGLDSAQRDKLRRYYEALEAGALRRSDVSGRLMEALGKLLNAGPAEILILDSSGVMRFSDMNAKRSFEEAMRAAKEGIVPLPEPGSEEWDEVDDLFRGGN